jgi:hypothetical protein
MTTTGVLLELRQQPGDAYSGCAAERILSRSLANFATFQPH